MSVAPWVWVLTIVVIAALLAFDFFFHVRKAHIPTLREAAIWSSIYVGVAIVFGILVLIFGGAQMGGEYFTGYLIEKALSVDNLFVFLVIIGSFAVPREDQQKVLLFGIVFALFARTAFILAGKAIIETWSWAFYIFGLFLIITAGRMLGPEKEDHDDANNFIIRFAKKHLRTSDHYDGDKLFTIENGKRVLTPMLLVMIAIGGTDLLFALDSVPAIYGVTTNVYIVFTATAFSLMGLRQLYFLIDGLLDRLVYLKYGLAGILAFIGVKLVLEALVSNQLSFINGGENVDVWHPSIPVSLTVIVVILTVTVVASLVSPTGRIASAVGSLDRAAHAYLHTEYHSDGDERVKQYEQIQDKLAKLRSMDSPKARQLADEAGLPWTMEKVEELHLSSRDK
ncbi:TerC/Alx family metal homeostasis membrane protein [Tessaracoccus terricola]